MFPGVCGASRVDICSKTIQISPKFIEIHEIPPKCFKTKEMQAKSRFQMDFQDFSSCKSSGTFLDPIDNPRVFLMIMYYLKDSFTTKKHGLVISSPKFHAGADPPYDLQKSFKLERFGSSLAGFSWLSGGLENAPKTRLNTLNFILRKKDNSIWSLGRS